MVIAMITLPTPVPRMETTVERQDDDRERQKNIDHALHDQIDTPAEVGTGDAEDGSQRGAHEGRGKTHQQGGA